MFIVNKRVVMAKVDEIAPDVFRISILEPQFNLQFNHFLIRDEEPLLFHAGYKRMFPELREAVTRLLNPESIRWVSFSHSDECGALNHWLEIAPKAQAAWQLRRRYGQRERFCHPPGTRPRTR